MADRSSVLIVDRSAESREVLKTALERRGWQILEASRATDGFALAQQHHPALIVLDMDSAGAREVQGKLAADADSQEIPVVLLGTVRRARWTTAGERINNDGATNERTTGDSSGNDENSARAGGRLGQIVAKPYHYGSLILKIEQMLRQGQQPAERV